MHVDIDTLVRQLGERLQAEEGLRPYLLIDPMLQEPLTEELLRFEECTTTTIPIERPGLSQEHKPRLIAWRPQAVGVLRASLMAALGEQADPAREASRGFAVGGWLQSAEPANVITRHLARQMWVARPQVGRVYLRLVDRRVFEWMWALLDEEQKATLLGPIAAWWTLDRCGNLVEHLSSRHAEGLQNGYNHSALTRDQWTSVDRCDLVQHLLRGWQRLARALPQNYLEFTAGALDGAQALGLESPQDLALMSAYVLQVHPRLCQHPQVSALVTGFKRNQGELSEALSSIPDPDGWDKIRQDLEQQFSTLPASQLSAIRADTRSANPR
ncbi:DUF4123 domain-containing protein [Luteimonas sp. SJ-92]|uniref:DUF4123 domain-containing protein n=1 Tax=Luteimonas salinisoli TaxID=2752307 RepID=A0A853JI99_9GAMM|nr:DUF4123 domain-containing protein [Luteimonas salinisoli]NZA28140.1 DUF4123 domain-containing protein [Luteimonas salinisoli]